jgi:hypothetical protein
MMAENNECAVFLEKWWYVNLGYESRTELTVRRIPLFYGESGGEAESLLAIKR